MILEFFVPGIPAPGGSKTAYPNPKTGGTIITEAGGNKTRDWRAVVALAAREAMNRQPTTLLAGPLKLTIEFCFHRSKSHYGTGRNADTLKKGAPIYHTVKPDITKLLRSTEDALTGVVWRDDAQVAISLARKRYGEIAGAQITVEKLEDDGNISLL